MTRPPAKRKRTSTSTTVSVETLAKRIQLEGRGMYYPSRESVLKMVVAALPELRTGSVTITKAKPKARKGRKA